MPDPSPSPSTRRLPILLGGVLALWNGAFALSGRFGVWLPVAAAALALDGLSLWAVPRLRRPTRPSAKAVALGVLAGVVQIVASVFLYPPIWRRVPGLWDEVNGLYRLMGHPNHWQAFAALPLVVVSEELIFRGAIQGGLEARWGRFAAVLAALAPYLLAHLASGNWALISVAAVCGLYWGLLRAATGNLWASVICHLLWDWAILVAIPLGA